jgi:hypothetical protein
MALVQAQCARSALPASGANGFPASHFAVPDWDVLRGVRDLIAPRLLWSPGRSPERNRGQRCEKNEGQGMFGAIRFFMARLLGYRRRLPQSCLVS